MSKAVSSFAAGEAKKRVIIFGGNGFVGSNISRLAVSRGWNVVVACRSGAPSVNEAWNASAQFVAIDALDRRDVYAFLADFGTPETTAIISTIGLLSLDHAAARRVNGDANLNIAAALYENKMPNIEQFVYVSAADMKPANTFLHGYYDGKRAVEKGLKDFVPGKKYAVLRPGFVYGSRPCCGFSIPLGLIGVPLAAVTTPLAAVLPTAGTVLSPPVHVETLAAAAVHCIEEPTERGIFELNDIKRLAKRL